MMTERIADSLYIMVRATTKAYHQLDIQKWEIEMMIALLEKHITILKKELNIT